MIIKEKTSQYRRDFKAILICEHCNHEQILEDGYDDAYFHREVIPKIKCDKCGKIAKSNYTPLSTRYSENEQL